MSNTNEELKNNEVATSTGFPAWMRSRRFAGIVILVLAVLHMLLVARALPPRTVTDGIPLASGDFSFYFASAAVAVNASEAGGPSISGYSTSFMAGYPWGTWLSFGKKYGEVFCSLWPGESVVTSFYVAVVLAALLIPVTVVLATRVAGCTRGEVICAALVAFGVYHFGDTVHFFWVTGMLAFPLSVGLVCLSGVLLCRAFGPGRGQWRVYAPLSGLLLGVSFWIHPLAALPAGVVWLTALVMGWRGQSRRSVVYGAMLVAGAVALVVTLPFLSALWQSRSLRAQANYLQLAAGWKHLIMDVFNDRAYRRPFDRRTFFHLTFVLAAVGGWSKRKTSAASVWLLAVSAFIVLICAYSFSYLPVLKQTQPYRYCSAAAMLAIVPAACGLKKLFSWAMRANKYGRYAVITVAIILAPAFTGVAADFFAETGAHGITESQKDVVEWLNGQSNQTGRVLCQPGTFGNMLPYHTGREVIGGSMSATAPLLHRYASFGDESVFKHEKDTSDFDEERRIAAGLRMYNIRYAVCSDKEYAAILMRAAGTNATTARIDPYTIVDMPGVGGGCFWETPGTGLPSITVSPVEIAVSNTSQGRYVLKYHYWPRMTSTEGTRVYPVNVGDDPVPFVAVENSGGASNWKVLFHK